MTHFARLFCLGVLACVEAVRVIPPFISFLQEEDELVVASCVLRSFNEEAYESPDEEEE